jgi:hypothetical protein
MGCKDSKELEFLRAENLNLESRIEELYNRISYTAREKSALDIKLYDVSKELKTSKYRNERLQEELNEVIAENGQLMKGINSWNYQDFPITRGFRIMYEFMMYIPFGNDEIVAPDIKFPEVFSISNDKNNFLKNYIFRDNNLYAFIFNEFSRYSWESTYPDYYPDLNEINNPWLAAEIFDKAAGFNVGYYKESDHIALYNVYRELGILVGIIIPTENLLTKFDKPLTINASQGLFGRPLFYIEGIDLQRGMFLTFYRLEKYRFLMIFYNGILQGICLI